MAVHVTRCPHCQTSFRVRDEQLSAANGMVRCGSCLQVFKASEHFVQAANTPTPTPAKSSAAAPTAAPEKKMSRPAVQPATTVVADDDVMDDIGLIHDDMDDEKKTIADDPYSDFNIRKPDVLSRPVPFEMELDESIFGLADANQNQLDFINGKAKEENTDADESWADALLDDSPAEDVRANDELNGYQPIANPLEDFHYERPPAEQDDFYGHIDEQDDTHAPYTLGGTDLDVEALEIPITPIAPALQKDPLQFNAKPPRKAFAWQWPLACVVMLLIAAVQVLYFQFDQWSRSPQWRPFYAQACQILNCTLPKVQNIRDMSTQHLVVRAHPTLQRALMVDTLLLNRSDYEQPFPDVQLSFKDLNDRVVASRRFTPSQYLSGELAGQRDMPSKTPIHIALEIVDPGPEAVSYAISLVANQ